MNRDDDFGFLDGLAEDIAPRILGNLFVRELPDGQRLAGIIVEVEAYGQTDAASHSYKGRTSRTEVMFGPPGHLYVYFTYGMHYCCNVVTGPEGYGSAVLIRAVEPIEGEGIMQANRGGKRGVDIANGPAKLCQAYTIDKKDNGADLADGPLKLILQDPVDPKDIVTTTRIGISQAQDAPWRWYVRGNPYVSKFVSSI
jgi:DNA-3-methyladenine glycosylase